MKCPFCGSTNSIVIKTEIMLSTKVRRRNCRDCNRSFATVETVIKRESRLKTYKEKKKSI